MGEKLGQRVTSKSKVRNILLALLAVSLIASFIVYNNMKKEQQTTPAQFSDGTKIGLATIVKSGDGFKIETNQEPFDLKELSGYTGRKLPDGRYFVWKSGDNPLPAGFYNPETPEKGVIDTIKASGNTNLSAKLFSLSPAGDYAAITAVQDGTGINFITIADTMTGKTIFSRKLENKERITDIGFCEEKKIAFLTENSKLYTIKF